MINEMSNMEIKKQEVNYKREVKFKGSQKPNDTHSPTHPGCFCIITANAVICSKMMKSIIEVWLATNTCQNDEIGKKRMFNIFTCTAQILKGLHGFRIIPVKPKVKQTKRKPDEGAYLGEVHDI